MTRELSFASRLWRWPFDLKPKECAAAAYGCRQTPYFGRQRDGIRSQDEWYCSANCFELGIVARLRKLRSSNFRRTVSHRVPLGLVLLSHGTITQAQLSQALAAQRAAGTGRLGEWLQQTGATGELEVTRALSQQWSCPLIKCCSANLEAAALLPWQLLEFYRMMPFHYAAANRTIYVAFSEHVTYSVLSAIESMLECRTEACLITPSEMDRNLDEAHRCLPSRGVVFERVQTDIEIAATVRSYALECSAIAARTSSCGDYIWARVLGKQNLDLLFRSSSTAEQPARQEQ
jgi:hypothetical protein